MVIQVRQAMVVGLVKKWSVDRSPTLKQPTSKRLNNSLLTLSKQVVAIRVIVLSVKKQGYPCVGLHLFGWWGLGRGLTHLTV